MPGTETKLDQPLQGGRHLGRRGVPEGTGVTERGNKAQKVGCGEACWSWASLLKDGPQGSGPLTT